MLGFIPDGYTREGYALGVPLLYDPIRFKYRPMLVQERQAFLEESTRHKPEENNRRSADLCVGRILSWNLAFPPGFGEGIVPITSDNVMRLQPELFEKLLGIVMGLDGGHADPQWTAAQKKELQAEQKESQDKKVSLSQVREANDAKN